MDLNYEYMDLSVEWRHLNIEWIDLNENEWSWALNEWNQVLNYVNIKYKIQNRDDGWIILFNFNQMGFLCGNHYRQI